MGVVSTVVASFFVCIVKSIQGWWPNYNAGRRRRHRSFQGCHRTVVESLITRAMGCRFVVAYLLSHENFNIGLRGKLIAATVLVAILSWAAESLSSLGERAPRLSRRAIIISIIKCAVAANRAGGVPGGHLSQCSWAATLCKSRTKLHSTHLPLQQVLITLCHGARGGCTIGVGRGSTESETLERNTAWAAYWVAGCRRSRRRSV